MNLVTFALSPSNMDVVLEFRRCSPGYHCRNEFNHGFVSFSLFARHRRGRPQQRRRCRGLHRSCETLSEEPHHLKMLTAICRQQWILSLLDISVVRTAMSFKRSEHTSIYLSIKCTRNYRKHLYCGKYKAI